MLVLYDKDKNPISIQKFLTRNTSPFIQTEEAYEIEKSLLMENFNNALENYETLFFTDINEEYSNFSKETFNNIDDLVSLLSTKIIYKQELTGPTYRDCTLLSALFVEKIKTLPISKQIEFCKKLLEIVPGNNSIIIIYSSVAVNAMRQFFEIIFRKIIIPDYNIVVEKNIPKEGEITLSEEESKNLEDIVELISSKYYVKLGSGYSGDTYKRKIFNLERSEEKNIGIFIYRLFILEKMTKKKMTTDNHLEFLELLKENYDLKSILLTIPTLKSNFIAYTQSLSVEKLENAIENFLNKDLFIPADDNIRVASDFIPGLILLEYFRRVKSIPEKFIDSYFTLLGDFSSLGNGYSFSDYGVSEQLYENKEYGDDITSIYTELFNYVKSRTELAKMLSYRTRGNLFQDSDFEKLINKRVFSKLKMRGILPEISWDLFMVTLKHMGYERYSSTDINSFLNRFESADAQKILLKYLFRSIAYNDGVYNLQTRALIKESFEFQVRCYLKIKSPEEKKNFIRTLANLATYHKSKLSDNNKIIFASFIEIISNSSLKNKTIMNIFEMIEVEGSRYGFGEEKIFGVDGEGISEILKTVPHRGIIDSALLRLMV